MWSGGVMVWLAFVVLSSLENAGTTTSNTEKGQ